MNWQDLQKSFAQVLSQSNIPSDDLLRIIQAPVRLNARQGLKIYQKNYQNTLCDALQDVYPVCERLVGAECFQSVARLYIQSHPSTDYDLNSYGDAFSQHIENDKALTELPYLADVARLEWAWHQSFYDPEEVRAFSPDDLLQVQSADPKRSYFILNKTIHLLSSIYPVLRIWETNQLDYQGDVQINLDEGGVKVLIGRHGLERFIVPVEPELWPLLVAIRAGQSLASLDQQLEATGSAQDTAERIRQLIERGWVVGFESI